MNEKAKSKKDYLNLFLESNLFSTLMSILLGFFIGGIVLSIAGFNPFKAYGILFQGVFGKPRNIVQAIIQATPVIITGISVVFAFKTGLFNIGAEGQFIMGSIAASFAGYFLIGLPGINSLPAILHVIIIIIFAMVAGGLYGGIVGFLKSKYGIHEVLSSIMFNWIALYFNNFYVEKSGFKKPKTEAVYEILDSAYISLFQTLKKTPEGVKQLNENILSKFANKDFGKTVADIIVRTDINFGIFIAIICAIVVWFLINKTTLGYSLKAVGSNKDAAEFAGINVQKNIFLAMAISGAISGLAGAVYIMSMSPHRVFIMGMMENYGFNGLSVALIGGIDPIGSIFAGLFFGALKYGGAILQSEIKAPTEIINIVIGVIVFFIGVKSIFRMIPIFLNSIKTNKSSVKGGKKSE